MAPETNERGEPGAGPRAGVVDDAIRLLKLALSRARSALLWERAWPAITAVVLVAGLFLAFSWAGFWLSLPPVWRTGCWRCRTHLIASLSPAGLRALPRRGEVLRRLDARTGSRIARPPPFPTARAREKTRSQALWSAHVEPPRGAPRALRAAGHGPRLAERDPYALRALVVLALVATFFMAEASAGARCGGLRFSSGAIAPRLYRVDAWVTPPVYTGRAPVLLPASPRRTAPGEIAAVSFRRKRAGGARHGSPSIDLAAQGGLTEDTADTPTTAAQGTIERRFKIGADGSLTVRGLPAGIATWGFRAVPDRAPTIAHAKDPEVLGRASVVLTYKIEDDYGVTQAEARFTRSAAPAREGAQPPRPLVAGPDFRSRCAGAHARAVGQTTRTSPSIPGPARSRTLVLIARDEPATRAKRSA